MSELERTFSNVRLEDYTSVGIHGLHGTYDDALTWLNDPKNRERPTVVLSMGSSLGNFDRPDAAAFLAQFAKLLGPDDMMVIGLDACEDPVRVYNAYNDAAGITRKFYENGLANANRTFGREVFKADEWKVVTEYDDIDGRHQAFYVPTKDVTIEGVPLKKGEKIVFEEAFKYSPKGRETLWHDAGLLEVAAFESSSDDYRMSTRSDFRAALIYSARSSSPTVSGIGPADVTVSVRCSSYTKS